METIGSIGARFAVRATSRFCDERPDVDLLDCEPCGKKRLAAEDVEAADAATAAANDRFEERFPLRYKNATAEHPEVLAWVEQFRVDPAHTPSLLLLGPTGTGKTHAGYGAVRAAASAPRRTRVGRFITPPWAAITYADLIASMRPSKLGDPEAVMRKHLEVDLLLLDDLALGKASEFVEEVTYRLLNGRYVEMRPSIFTSNLPLEQLRESLGDRIASRLAETCTRVVLAGDDRRRPKRPAA
jgi:DNA replication protein DnaC